MKTRVMLMAMMAMSTVIMAQELEVDDMYFTAKDRLALNAKRGPKFTADPSATKEEILVPLNPTDSYSARNVNPEYISRAKMDPNSQTAAAPYFIPNYQPKAVNQGINSILNSSAWNNSSSWNNPFNSTFGFNSFNTYSWMYPYNSWAFNNYYFSPWSSWLTMSMGYAYGGWNNWGGPSWSFWNNNFGWNSWNNGFNFYGNNWGNSWANNGFFGQPISPGFVIINTGEAASNNVVYGKRASRSSDVDNNVINDGRSSVNYVDSNGLNRGSQAGGRTSDGGSASYYDRGWRSNPASSGSNSTSGAANSGRSTNLGESWWNNSNNNHSTNADRSWSDGGRSNSSSAFGGSGAGFSTGGGRSSGGGVSGGSAGGSSGGGRTRGRD